MRKADLRKIYIQKLASLDKEGHSERSKKIAQNFFKKFDLKDIKSIHIFIPIEKKNEVDTWLIINHILKEYSYISVIVPKSDFKTFQMTHHGLKEGHQLAPNDYGILEPQSTDEVDELSLDLVIVPLLAFDKKGYRVGYGKGFYDRFLMKCRPYVIKVGLSFFVPEEEIGDINEHDVSLDYCVTPSEIIEF